MPTQYQVEMEAGITDDKIAQYIMGQKTSAAKNAYNLLVSQVKCFEHCGFTLLKCAVADCKKEMSEL